MNITINQPDAKDSPKLSDVRAGEFFKVQRSGQITYMAVRVPSSHNSVMLFVNLNTGETVNLHKDVEVVVYSSATVNLSF